MSKLHFDYRMELSYSQPVTECHYTLKCIPQNTDMQSICELSIEIMPSTDYQTDTDPFGNLMIYDNLYLPHSSFEVHISGVAETWLSVHQRDCAAMPVYRYPHGLNRASAALQTYFHSLQPVPNASAYETAMHLMHCLYRDFAYRPNTTTMETSAESAWTNGCGVCQDYAHILIALCHLAGIPARYVTGMVIGEGQSHARTEILDNGYWYALDPTHDCIAAETYIKIGHGRDAKDCMLNKGIIKGGGSQQQTVTVLVENLS